MSGKSGVNPSWPARAKVVDEMWHMAILWHGIDALPRLRRMSPAERMAVMQEARALSEREPLWLHPERDLVVKSWGERKHTGGYVTALLVFGLWVHVGEREEVAGFLVEEWPELKVASMLCSKIEAAEGI
jgi:hypothetical protein